MRKALAIAGLLVVALFFAWCSTEGKKFDLQKLETGDVLLLQSKQGDPLYWFAQLLKNAFNCDFIHACLYLGNGIMAESIASGVQLSPLEPKKESIAKILRYPELTVEQKAVMRIQSEAMVGTPYPNIRILIEIALTFLKDATIKNPIIKLIAKPILGIAALILGVNQENRLFTSLESSDGCDTMTCAEFVGRILNEIGIQPELQKTFDFFLPNDFLLFPFLVEVE